MLSALQDTLIGLTQLGVHILDLVIGVSNLCTGSYQQRVLFGSRGQAHTTVFPNAEELSAHLIGRYPSYFFSVPIPHISWSPTSAGVSVLGVCHRSLHISRLLVLLCPARIRCRYLLLELVLWVLVPLASLETWFSSLYLYFNLL